MRIGKLYVSDGAIILLSICFLFDTENVLPIFLFAALIHELGHLLILRRSGGTLHQLRLGCCGAVIYCNMPMRRYHRVLVCLSGPIASILLYIAANMLGYYTLAGASLVLGLFNLMPMPPLDGGMILQHAIGERHQMLCQFFSFVSAALLLAFGVLLAWNGFGIWLFVISVAVVIQMAKRLAKSQATVYNRVERAM